MTLCLALLTILALLAGCAEPPPAARPASLRPLPSAATPRPTPTLSPEARQSSTQVPRPTTEPRVVALRDDFERPDASGDAAALGAAGTGQAWHLGGSALPAAGIYGGRFTHEAEPPVSSYAHVDVGVVPTRLSGLASFAGTIQPAGAALGIATNADVPDDISKNMVHLAFGTSTWDLTVWVDGTITSLINGSYPPLTTEEPYPFGLVIEGDVATVELPDGTTRSVTDPRIPELHGQYVYFENYQVAGPVPRWDAVHAEAAR